MPTTPIGRPGRADRRAVGGALCRRNFFPVHDRGQVWMDVATMLAEGGEAIADIDTLRQQAARRGGVPADGVAEPR